MNQNKQPISSISFAGISGGLDAPARLVYQFIGGVHSLFVAGRSWHSVTGDDFLTMRYDDLDP